MLFLHFAQSRNLLRFREQRQCLLELCICPQYHLELSFPPPDVVGNTTFDPCLYQVNILLILILLEFYSFLLHEFNERGEHLTGYFKLALEFCEILSIQLSNSNAIAFHVLSNKLAEICQRLHRELGIRFRFDNVVRCNTPTPIDSAADITCVIDRTCGILLCPMLNIVPDLFNGIPFPLTLYSGFLCACVFAPFIRFLNQPAARRVVARSCQTKFRPIA